MDDCPHPLGGSPVKTRIPWLVKAGYSLFLAFLVYHYLNYPKYGPANFLWFCDIALVATAAALWLESPFLASMQLVAVLLPSLVWLADLAARLTFGVFLTGWTHYMFRSDIPPLIRALSLYHAWLPFFLLWVVGRLGYDGRGWVAQSLLAWVVLPVCYAFTDPARALNGVFGPSGQHPQTWMHPLLWLALVMVAYPLGVFLLTHLLLRLVYARKNAVRKS